MEAGMVSPAGRTGIASSWHFDATPRNDRLLFHPHCHQRAQGPAADGLPGGTNATLEMLRSCGYEVELSEAGCCGMAGTFGYEAEHYELSMRVGELKLFPLLTPSDPSGHLPHPVKQDGGGKAEVVATGAACRMQIRQGTGVEAEHPIVLAARALIGPSTRFG